MQMMLFLGMRHHVVAVGFGTVSLTLFLAYLILPVMEGVCSANLGNTGCPSTYILSEKLPYACPMVLILVGFTYAGCWKLLLVVL